MFLTLAAVIFIASIFIFFSQEFIRTLKKIFAIKGAMLILPLALASWLVYTFDYWFLWLVYYYREMVQGLLIQLTTYMPFQEGAYSVVLIVFLTVISVVPVFLLDWFLWKRNYKRYAYPYVTSTIIWLISAVLLVVI